MSGRGACGQGPAALTSFCLAQVTLSYASSGAIVPHLAAAVKPPAPDFQGERPQWQMVFPVPQPRFPSAGSFEDTSFEDTSFQDTSFQDTSFQDTLAACCTALRCLQNDKPEGHCIE